MLNQLRIVGCWFLVVPSVICVYQPRSWQADELLEIEQMLIATQSPIEWRKKVRGMLREFVRDHRTEDVVNSDHDSVALNTKWESTIDSIHKDRSHSATELNRFIGWLEGRLRVSIPVEWRDGLLHLRIHEDKNTRFDGRKTPEIEPTDDWWFFRKGKTLSDDREFAINRATGKTVRLPEELLQIVSDDSHNETVFEFTFVESNRCVVRSHGTSLGAYPVYVLDGDSGQIIWKATVFGGEFYGGASGGGNTHWTEIVLSKGRLFVFGLSDSGAYIECFDRETGNVLFRFNSTASLLRGD